MGIRGIVESEYVATGIPTLASATAVTLQSNRARVTGNTTISTINLPVGNAYFEGPLFLFNTDSSVGGWDTGGNIAVAGTFTRYHLFVFMYDPAVSKWYPSALS